MNIIKLKKKHLGNYQKMRKIYYKKENENSYHYIFGLNASSGLEKVIYILKTVLKLSKYYGEVLIIDNTFKTNKLNMPIVNFILTSR